MTIHVLTVMYVNGIVVFCFVAVNFLCNFASCGDGAQLRKNVPLKPTFSHCASSSSI